MYNMDANRTYGEKAWQQLQKKAASYIEQVLEATPHKTVAIRPPTTHPKTNKVRRSRHAGHRWRSKDEVICDILLWTPLHGRAKAGCQARTYIEQLCADTGYSRGDMPGAMDERDEWRERMREILTASVTWWWWYLGRNLKDALAETLHV